MCATASQLLAEHSLYNDREVAFVGGLLHDVGKIVLGSYVAERLPIIQAYCLKYGSSFVEAERADMGFDHAEVGGRIAAQWNLPSPLVNAITYHHNPIQNGSINPFIALIYLGNRLCFSTPSEVLDSLADEGNAQCMEALRLTPQHISNVLQQLGEQMDKVPLLTME